MDGLLAGEPSNPKAFAAALKALQGARCRGACVPRARCRGSADVAAPLRGAVEHGVSVELLADVEAQ